VRHGLCHRHGEDYGPCSCTLGKIPRLIEPILLYLLAAGRPAHGYELMERAGRLSLTDAGIDAGAIYRALRHLEGRGCVVSEWSQGGRGPNRRVYALTEEGRKQLQDWSVVLERSGSAMVDLSRRCNELRTTGTGAGPRSARSGGSRP